ncbi:MAG: hypothetical protein ACE5FN_08140 [Leptospirillia bacterium]
MSLEIHAEPLPAGSALRSLVIDRIPSIVPDGRVVVSELPLPGAPVLALDGEGVPVVVAFDADGGKALTEGLSATEKVQENAAWLVALCPGIPDGCPFDRVRLMVLSPKPPAGARHLVLGMANLFIATIRAVRIGRDLGLLVEPWQPEEAPLEGPSRKACTERTHIFRTGQITLTEEEEAFFKSL